jgi:hypothetical protein
VNRVEVQFVVDESGQGRASIAEIDGAVATLAETSTASAVALSAASQKIEGDLLKQGFSAKAARDAALQYEATMVQSASTVAKAYGEEAAAAELSAAKQKAAAESLQRQRSAAIVSQAREAERASASNIIEQERARLARAAVLQNARTQGILPEEEGAAFGGGLRGQRALLRAGGRAVGLPGEATQIGGLGLYGGGIAALGAGIAGLAAIREVITLASEARKAELDLAVAARDTGESFAVAARDAATFHKELVADREESVKLASAFGELKLKIGASGGGISEDAIKQLSTIANARGISADEFSKTLRELSEGGEAAKKAFTELTGHDANLFLQDYARSIHRTTGELDPATTRLALFNELLNRSGEYTQLADQRMSSVEVRIKSLKNSFGDFLHDTASFVKAAQAGASVPDIQDYLAGKRPPDSPEQQRLNASIAAEAAKNVQAESLQFQYEKYFADRQQKNIETGIAKNPLAQLRDTEREYAQFLQDASQLSDQARDKISGQFISDLHTLRESIASLRREATSFAEDLSARAEGNNPFTKLALSGERALENLRLKFAPLGDEVVNQFERMEKAGEKLETFTLRIQTGIKAADLEFRADFLEKNLGGATAEQARALAILQKQVEAAASAPALQRESEAYRRGFRPQNDYQVRQDEIRDYENVKRLRPTGSDEAARTAQKLIDDYILAQTKNLPINARFSPDAFTRELGQDRAAALEASAKRLQSQIQDEIKRAEAGRAGVQLATRELEELAKHAAGSGPERDTLRAEFLKITDKLNPSELTGALRQGVILASREEAQHVRQLEQEDKSFREKLVGSGGILYQIKDVIAGKQGGHSPEFGGDLGGGAGIFRKAHGGMSDAAKLIAATAQDAAQAAQAEAIANRFTNPSAQGYNPSLNQIAFAGAGDQDEKLNAFMRAKAEGRIFGDAAALFTANAAHGKTEVNKYAQELFRARPGYTALNDPRVFDAANPYQQAFLHAGYLNSLRSSSYMREAERPMTRADFVDVLNSFASNGRLKVDSGPAAQINISSKDLNAQISTLGPAMTSNQATPLPGYAKGFRE